ncbi:hypothetical protein JEU11_00850 [Paraglaciecola chathamensis]|uniref:TIGR03016 family PEP-CTERM system-associated outer membrane protein n=2 Tax=Paraglaciecola chathamensis TaxID=368405 RepID=A0ABS0W9E9_9ALTE|nr:MULTISPECIES: hypothetical protein [Paraglaciecola]MBJ2134991.1 hypothetical protein [Paraglaciecola chathamensis]GAC03563.1 hypothetical protein GAGA_0700 [Paraglaciecola agarilytica NO2]
MSVNTAPIIRNKVLIAVALACGSASSVGAGEIKIAPSITTSGYYYKTEIGEEPSENTEAVSIIPKLVTLYNARVASASLVLENTTVEQRSDRPNTDKSFTEFRYNASTQLIENSLTFSVNGDHSYRAIEASDTIIADKVLSSSELTKTTSDAAQLSFMIPNPKFIGLSFQTGFSKTSSDDTLATDTGLNGETTFASAQLYQGGHFKGFTFLLSSQYYDTKRDSAQDYASTLSSARVGLDISSEISFVLVGSDSDYGLDESGFSGERQNLDTTSYGAGFIWNPYADNTIEITYNKLDEGDNTTGYVGINTQWAFSERTAMQFTYGKRFYGDAYSFNFDYKLKSFSANATYNEDVTSYSRLSFEAGPTSLFVCPIGSTEFAECFQPNSADYALQAGEEFRGLNSFTTDITDETLFRKSGRIGFGYDKGKLNASLNLTNNTTEYLESNRDQTTNTASLSLSYRLNRRNTLGLSSSFSSVDYSDSDLTNDVTNLTINFNRKLSRQLTMDVSARYVERETEDENRDLTDSRLTVSLNYQF